VTPRQTTPGGGEHHLFRWPGFAVKNSAGTIAPGIDIRGSNGYVAVAPSTLDNGRGYRWTADPLTTPLAEAPDWLLEMCRAEHSGPPAMLQRCQKPSLCVSGVSAISGVSVTVEPAEIVRMTLPKVEGERNARIMALARGLRHNAGLSTVQECRPHLREWHRLALPIIKTKHFSDTELDFEHAFERARYPLGVDLAMLAAEQSKELPMPAAAEPYEGHVRHLIATCARLQEMQGEHPFSLSVSQAARLLWGEPPDDPGKWASRRTRAGRWLRKLTADGVLEVVEKGKPGPAGSKATRYRYRGEP
jgi:hypothetical protein